MNADIPHVHLAPEERKSVIDALLQEIDKTQKWTRLVAEMHAEIARLRLTDAERRDIKIAADAYADDDNDPDCERIAATLRGLLERLK